MCDEPPPFPTKPPPGANAPFVIVVDTREQTPLAFPTDVPTIRAGLHTGDYSIAGCEDQFTVERKSLADLVHTIIHERARFERELERMQPFAFRRVICTASMDAVRRGKYKHSRANPNAVVASIATFEVRYNVPFVFAGSSDEAARRIVDWARYFTRERARLDHERMLAGHHTPPPGVGSFNTKSTLHPYRQGATNEVIPTKVHESVKNCLEKMNNVAAECMKVPNGGDERKSKDGANT